MGDITLGRAGQYPPGGSKQLLGRIARDLRAPVSLGNLETALVDPSVAARLPAKCNAKSPDCFLFGAPMAYARGLRDVGFTVLNLANNHTNDYGEVGQAWTVLALARAGLRSTGRPEQITVLKVRGLRVAVLGFAPYSWASDLRDLKKVRALVSAAARARGPRGRHDAHRCRRACSMRTFRAVQRRISGAARQLACVRPRGSSTQAPISSSATARTSCAAWSGIADA